MTAKLITRHAKEHGNHNILPNIGRMKIYKEGGREGGSE